VILCGKGGIDRLGRFRRTLTKELMSVSAA
jgi:hypothetical protein